ncbi:MAG: Type secretion system protein TadC, associated with Flp pilus assembly [Polyangiaceae bacterium]|jgi:tight adherence protein C|nr:Type secretion system protein TadC, associated with Flp pilus assembly [Polyangiaceae bacterium]
MSLAPFLLRVTISCTTFATLFLVTYTVASVPSALPSYLGVRGLKRLRAEQKNGLFRSIEPILRWLGARIRPLLSDTFRGRIDRQITLSGDFWGLQPEECVALTIFSLLAGLSAGAVYGTLLSRGFLYVLLGGMIGGMLPYLQLTGIEQERRKRVQNGLPYVIDLLSLGLSAGLDFPGALRQVIDKSSSSGDALIEELNLILQELQVGKTRKQALEQLVTRVPCEVVREFVGAVTQAEERGNPLGHVLEIQAEASRQRRSTRAEEAASRASVKMLGPMVLVFAAILLLIVSPMFLQIQDAFQGD